MVKVWRGMMGSVMGGGWSVALLLWLVPGLSSAAEPAMPPLSAPVERALKHALDAGDCAAIGLLVGTHREDGAILVTIAASSRQDLAADIAHQAALQLPSAAPVLAAAATIANPGAAPVIARAVAVVNPSAASDIADAVIAMLPAADRERFATKIRADVIRDDLGAPDPAEDDATTDRASDAPTGQSTHQPPGAVQP